MRILVHDFGGYAFPLDLSRELARRGHEALHVYCGSLTTTPPGISDGTVQERLSIEKITLDAPLSKYNFLKRWRQETRYGRLAVETIRRFAPDVIVSANTPLDAQKQLLLQARSTKTPFVYWLQDLLGIAADGILRKKIPGLGAIVGAHYVRLEQSLLGQSDAIVPITDDFLPLLQAMSLSNIRTEVIPNWAPLAGLPRTPRKNDWAHRHGLEDAFSFLYTGTLGMKHNPALLLHLAHAIRERHDVRLVVVSQGMGADWLKAQVSESRLDNVLILPYQEQAALPQVLGTADALVALLEPDAGRYSVPSKVLTYLCAQRPLLLAVPMENLAARLVREADAGIVTSPTDPDAFVAAARRLLEDDTGRDRMGRNGRIYAASNFPIAAIGDRFEALLYELTRSVSPTAND